MNILHIFSSTFYAGSVAYALALSERQIADNHTVFIISDSEILPTKALCSAIPVTNRKHLQRFKNITFIRKFINNNKIDVVHAHSRAASWLSYFSVLGKKIPLISTIHGRQHMHASTSLYDIYGDRIIAVCPNLFTHLVNEVKMKPHKISVIANGFDSAEIDKFLISDPFKLFLKAKENTMTIAFIGRFNGLKGDIFAEILEKIFPKILDNYPTIKIQLIGGEYEVFPEKGKKAVIKLNEKHPNSVEVIGFVKNLQDYIAKANLVIGAGRVAIEALYMNTDLLALGEASVIGLIDEKNIQLAIDTNFGDILPVHNTNYHDLNVFENELIKFLESYSKEPKKNINTISMILKKHFDLEKNYQELMQIYKDEISK